MFQLFEWNEISMTISRRAAGDFKTDSEGSEKERSSSAMKEGKASILSEFPLSVVESLRDFMLQNDYVMMESLGNGSFSMIYHVFSRRHDRDFAAKVTNTASTRHRTARTASAREEEALRRLSHPNIVKLYDTFQHDNFQILILELCAPTTLRSLIQTSHPRPVPHLLAMIGQLCSAVAYMHSNGVVHRDIKPSNILLGEHGRLVVADFGMAETFTQGELATDFAGSPHYIAPEVFCRVPYDPAKADVWALGVTFYEMAMGIVRTQGDKNLMAQSIVKGGLFIALTTPPLIRRIVSRMTEMSPARRPNVAAVLAIADIQAAMKSEAADGTFARNMPGTPGPLALATKAKKFVFPSGSFIRRVQRISPQPTFNVLISDPPDPAAVDVAEADTAIREIE
jgi:serine/threonine protein kinase